jgi:hypothetical protein
VVVNVNTVLAPGERRVIVPDIPPRAIAGSTWGWMVIVPPTMRPSAGCSSDAAEWFLNVLPAATSELVRATTLLPDTSFAPGPNR